MKRRNFFKYVSLLAFLKSPKKARSGCKKLQEISCKEYSKGTKIKKGIKWVERSFSVREIEGGPTYFMSSECEYDGEYTKQNKITFSKIEYNNNQDEVQLKAGSPMLRPDIFFMNKVPCTPMNI